MTEIYLGNMTRDEYEEGLELMKEDLEDCKKELWNIMRDNACSCAEAMEIYLELLHGVKEP